MALKTFGFIVSAAEFSGAPHRSEIAVGDFRMIIHGVGRPQDGAEAARLLLADGAQLIELCGGFSAHETADVLTAVDGAVPVGAVRYGPEAIAGMHALFN